MYELSRALYRDLAPLVDDDGTSSCAASEVLRACESTVDRIIADRDFAHPASSLFQQVRWRIRLADQLRARRAIDRHIRAALSRSVAVPDELAESQRCSMHSRSGMPCRREALAGTGYCPSHLPREVDGPEGAGVREERAPAAVSA